MDLLVTDLALVLVIAGGCYSPELRDCTLSCGSLDDCADGQVCGTDNFCAAPGIAGNCSSLPVDAAVNHRDAGVDAPKMPDARPDAASGGGPQVLLTISIDGKGRVDVDNVGTCDASPPQRGDCNLLVPWGAFVTVEASPYSDWRFSRWTTPVCALVPFDICGFTAIRDTTIGVKFRKEDD